MITPPRDDNQLNYCFVFQHTNQLDTSSDEPSTPNNHDCSFTMSSTEAFKSRISEYFKFGIFYNGIFRNSLRISKFRNILQRNILSREFYEVVEFLNKMYLQYNPIMSCNNNLIQYQRISNNVMTNVSRDSTQIRNYVPSHINFKQHRLSQSPPKSETPHSEWSDWQNTPYDYEPRLRQQLHKEKTTIPVIRRKHTPKIPYSPDKTPRSSQSKKNKDLLNLLT